MSNQQPAEPTGPQPTDAPTTAMPVSGEPWSSPSGDALAPEAYRPAMAELPEPYRPPADDEAPSSDVPTTVDAVPSARSGTPATAIETPAATGPDAPPTKIETPGYETPGYETPGYQPPAPPVPPTFKPGYASLPKPREAQPLPPTSTFPQQGYTTPEAGRGGYPPQPDPSQPYPPPSPQQAQAAGYGPQPGYNSQPGYAPQQAYPPPSGYPGQQGGGYGPPPGYGAPPPGYGRPPRPPKRSNAPIVAVIVAVTLLLCGGLATAGVLAFNSARDRAREAIKPITDPPSPTDAPQVPGPTDDPLFPTSNPDPDSTGKTISVVYEVTGDGPATILYVEKLGESPKRVDNATLPWRFETTMQGSALISVTAVRSGVESGTISCRATVDGEEVAQRTREGTFATASCLKMMF